MADIRTNDAPAAALAAPPPAAQPAAAHADPAAATAQHDRPAEHLDGQPAPPPAGLPPLAAAPASTTSQPPPPSTTSDEARAKRFRPDATNEWDRMPAEIQSMILAHAGVLTLWLNGRIDHTKLNLELFKSMLCDVFETNWQGELIRLPFDEFEEEYFYEPYWRIRTRSMHARVKALRFNNLDEGLEQAAILNGWNDLLDFDKPEGIAFNAAICGSIVMLEHLVDERKAVTLDKKHVIVTAHFGHLELLKWLGGRMPDGSWSTQVMDEAAGNGHIDCVKWLHANRTEGCKTRAMDGAAFEGRLDVVKFLHTNRTEGCTTIAMDYAAKNGHLAVVEFLHSNRTEGCTKIAMQQAALFGHADVVEFLHKNRSEGNVAEAVEIAVEWNYLAVIQRIHSLAPELITPEVVDKAVKSGRFPLLDWIIGNTPVRPTDKSLTFVVTYGQMRAVYWFRKRLPDMLRNHSMFKLDGLDTARVMELFDRDDLPTSPADLMRLAIKERHVPVIVWLMRHMPRGWWDAGDLYLARGLIRNA
ncbi:hypothetical protein HK105_206351 [Polyrhizophydium stewartii]|uniref:Ankyrin repeat protein n=1 Tax=Polyrhizophydium stewartii TaxID=2732419 RepID=A0ABR4N3H5_9FUNG